MMGSFGSIAAKKFLSAVSLSWTLEEVRAGMFAVASDCGTKQIPHLLKPDRQPREQIAHRTF